jgi:hypothetical protein
MIKNVKFKIKNAASTFAVHLGGQVAPPKRDSARPARVSGRGGGNRWKIFRAFAQISTNYRFLPLLQARVSAISANFRPPSPIGMRYGAPRVGGLTIQNEKCKIQNSEEGRVKRVNAERPGGKCLGRGCWRTATTRPYRGKRGWSAISG